MRVALHVCPLSGATQLDVTIEVFRYGLASNVVSNEAFSVLQTNVRRERRVLVPWTPILYNCGEQNLLRIISNVRP